MKDVVFTVYTCTNGRWVRGNVFNADQRDDAIESAKGQFGGGKLDGVSVVKETYHPDDGSTDELAIYSDKKNDSVAGLGVPEVKKIEVPKDKAPQPSEQPDGPSGGKSSAADGDDDEIPDIPEMPKASGAVFVVSKIVLALVLAGTAAGGVSFVLGTFGGYSIFSNIFGNQGIPQKVFGIIFLLTLLIVLPNLVGWSEMMKAFSVTPHRPVGPRVARPRRRVEAMPETPETYAPPKPERAPELTPTTTASPEHPPEPTETEAPEETEANETIIEAKKSVMTFMGRSLQFISESDSELLKGGKLSAFNQFGTDLFLAGAAEAYSDSHGIKDDMPKVIEGCVQATGRSADRASQFSVKYDSYLLEPRYLDMFRSGRDAMNTFMRDEVLRAKAAAGELDEQEEKSLEDESETDIGIFLVNALDDWNVKSDTVTSSGTVTVLFTDIVASTAFTQEHGDEVSQQLVNAHNRVVREALRRYDGREIKHTGDGIMAGFGQATQGVEAAIDMMRGLEKHNANVPDLPLHLNIGINAGEPIQEDDDLFGTPVQLAARVCAFAGTDQIAVSKLVKDLCAGKGLKFNDLGEVEFKGFAEKIPVSEVLWRQAADDEGGDSAIPKGKPKAAPN